MFNKTPSGYEVEWKRHEKSNISSIFYDNVNFLDIYIEYYLPPRKLKITAAVTDDPNPMAACPPVILSMEFSMELLEDFGTDIRDISKVSQDPERFVINVIKITSDLGYWSKSLQSFLSSKKYQKKINNNMPLNYSSTYNGAPSNYQEKQYFYDESFVNGDKEKIKSLSAQIEQKNNKIKDLEEELQELKEDIKMLKAINQEC
jgi:hypothetical protein